ncbi:glycosyl hydrolase family 95 catalytic domain-containing protein [Catenulispora acidiphila]|uniref:glycosyl hydrolase family 95 catalytic domain-containing protein n=1 Tax=Catenulispora acidiphila TaxID=304895 RepID=UPI001CBC1289|nr:hypothetical protein [Catenulispora acidiphila]
MSSRKLSTRLSFAIAAVLVATPALIAGGLAPPAAAATTSTAWQNGAFQVNASGVVSRSDVVLGRPNTANTQSLPLGNGSLGVAEWAAGGFTAQLNRSDTMPNRLSPGQLNIPGLSAMTNASNFTGTLDLYNGVLTESGGGMTLHAWVPAGKDELVVDVTGANPGTQQTATLSLWSGRTPSTAASGQVASLAQTWVDNSQTGSSGQTFGAMAAVTAGGQNVTASVVNSTQVQVGFKPNADGSFRVVVASPKWTGGDPTATANSVIGSDATASSSSLLATQSAWWNNYWGNSGLIEMNSSDGTAQYMENLRTLYLYFEAATMHAGTYPGSQAGVADLFNFSQDKQDWYPAGYWLWNLRGQLAANISSGDFALNTPIFDMYLNDLPAIESWTSAQMGGKAGACVPETMRFNGNGYYNGGNNTQNASCAQASSPTYNALTITSGAEIALWVWQQYQDTGNAAFLQKYYPILKQTATFLLAYQSVGSDHFLHATANAHETQWAVPDPTTDIAASQALFDATVKAATQLNTDSALVSQLNTALGEIEPYARSNAGKTQLLNAQPTSASAAAGVDAQGTDIIGDSYQPAAKAQNGENIGLEPVWPFGLIGDNTVVNGDNLTALAQRTYTNRVNKTNPDWNFDAVQAARLGLGSEVASDLNTVTQNYQAYISGMANLFNGSVGDEPYIEQSSTVATALDEALAQDYDGTLRFAPAWPSGWDVSGTVAIQGGSKVDVQVEGGTLATAAIQAGTTQTMTVRNPWPGKQAEVVNGSSGAVVVAATTNGTLSVPVTAGSTYLVEQPSALTTSLPFAQVTGTKATAAKHLGKVQIGLDGGAVSFPNLAASFNNVGISADTNTAPGSFDGGGASFSETALTNAHAGPGASVASSGVTFTFPNAAAGSNDNTVAAGQTISLSGSGTLGFLVSASYGPATGSGTVNYTDGSTQSYSITAPDWFSTTPPSGGALAISSAYQNRQGNTTYSGTGNIFSVPVALTAGKSVASVTLPGGGPLTSGTPAIHVFALATSGSGSSGSAISLRAHANGDIVTADNTGTSPLIANRTTVGAWETFDLINNTDGSVSLRAHANGDIVTADNAGASPLIANRTSIGPWEEFDLITNADGSVSFRSHANSDIVTADNAGAAPLIANRTSVGPWESFDLIHD